MRGFIDPETKSVIEVPIIVGGAWWGFIGFDDCLQEREWSAAEKDGFRAAADMLGAAITKQRTHDALIEAKAGLEQRVQARTRELQEEILEKDHAHSELAEAQQRLMELSRLSGMAEVATGVLHNVGNVLNSVNVSASLVADHVRASRVENLASVIGLLRDHEADLGAFLDRDPKGRRLVPYLDNLSRHLSQERLSMLEELGQLTHHVGHIKEIVAMQQNYARMSGVIEKVIVEALVEDALRMMQAGLDRDRVRLYREYEDLPPVSTDKHKFLQIVLNLLNNARDAVREKDQRQREIRIRLQRSGEASFRVQICDNGIGVPPEHLDRIFSHGFTTKEGGHGFGLHAGALAARELGGSLTVTSGGPGCGATFTLDLPLQPAESLERRATA